MDIKLWETIGREIEHADTATAADRLETLLRTMSGDTFRSLADLHFSNKPAAVLTQLNQFIETAANGCALQAVYCEMNAFDINPDRWYFDMFGYDRYNDDPEDLAWLADETASASSTILLTGLEAVQADFARFSFIAADDAHSEHATVRETAVLLVMVRFVQLIERALSVGPLAKRVPILATAHDFDIVWRSSAVTHEA